jgi:hypothetical protein
MFEANQACVLVPPADTVPIEDTAFGSRAVADTCSFSLNCKYTENITDAIISPLGDYWFTAQKGANLFQMHENYVSYDNLETD